MLFNIKPIEVTIYQYGVCLRYGVEASVGVTRCVGQANNPILALFASSITSTLQTSYLTLTWRPPVSRNMERQQGHGGLAFPLIRLPRELRDHVYRLMVTSVLRYPEFEAEPECLFDRAILCTNRQVHTEASAAIAKTVITILVDFWQLLSQTKYVYRSPLDFTSLPFKRYSIDFYYTNKTVRPLGSPGYQIQAMRWHIHRIAKALTSVPHLEHLHINWFKPESDSSQNDDTNVKQGHHPGPLPDDMMDCFFQLRGFQDVVITGNVADAYVGRVTRSLKRPKLAPHLLTNVITDYSGGRCMFVCSRLAVKDSDQVIPNQHH